MSQPDKLSSKITESPYNPSPIDVEKGLGSTYPAAPSSPSSRSRFSLRPGRFSLLKLLIAFFLLFLFLTALGGGFMFKRTGSADPRKWNVDPPANQGEEAKDAYPWECRKGLWSCNGAGLRS